MFSAEIKKKTIKINTNTRLNLANKFTFKAFVGLNFSDGDVLPVGELIGELELVVFWTNALSNNTVLVAFESSLNIKNRIEFVLKLEFLKKKFPKISTRRDLKFKKIKSTFDNTRRINQY